MAALANLESRWYSQMRLVECRVRWHVGMQALPPQLLHGKHQQYVLPHERWFNSSSGLQSNKFSSPVSTSYESEVTGVGLDLVTGRNRAAGKICNLVAAGGFQANEFDCA